MRLPSPRQRDWISQSFQQHLDDLPREAPETCQLDHQTQRLGGSINSLHVLIVTCSIRSLAVSAAQVVNESHPRHPTRRSVRVPQHERLPLWWRRTWAGTVPAENLSRCCGAVLWLITVTCLSPSVSSPRSSVPSAVTCSRALFGVGAATCSVGLCNPSSVPSEPSPALPVALSSDSRQLLWPFPGVFLMGPHSGPCSTF